MKGDPYSSTHFSYTVLSPGVVPVSHSSQPIHHRASTLCTQAQLLEWQRYMVASRGIVVLIISFVDQSREVNLSPVFVQFIGSATQDGSPFHNLYTPTPLSQHSLIRVHA